MSKKKVTRNKQEKINLIYKTFFDLVLKNGYSKTSTNHIAEAAKLSIGTIYRYFPNGKSDIILKYFETSKDIVFDTEDFKKLNGNNFADIFERFIRNNLENQKKNPGYCIAFREAILSDKELLEKYKAKIANICTELVKELRHSNEFLKGIPEDRLIRGFIFVFNLIEANIHHHLFIMKIVDDEDYFIKLLSRLVEFARNFIQKTS